MKDKIPKRVLSLLLAVTLALSAALVHLPDMADVWAQETEGTEASETDTTALTEAPETTAPTEAPETTASTEAPETTAPTEAPETTAPTEAPETTAPTEAPETMVPTEAPETTAPEESTEKTDDGASESKKAKTQSAKTAENTPSAKPQNETDGDASGNESENTPAETNPAPASVEIRVAPESVGLALQPSADGSSISLSRGKVTEFLLTAAVEPEVTETQWSSSDPETAQIGTDGKVTVLKPGTTVIAARAGGAEDCVTLCVFPGAGDFSLALTQAKDTFYIGDPVTARVSLADGVGLPAGVSFQSIGYTLADTVSGPESQAGDSVTFQIEKAFEKQPVLRVTSVTFGYGSETFTVDGINQSLSIAAQKIPMTVTVTASSSTGKTYDGTTKLPDDVNFRLSGDVDQAFEAIFKEDFPDGIDSALRFENPVFEDKNAGEEKTISGKLQWNGEAAQTFGEKYELNLDKLPTLLIKKSPAVLNAVQAQAKAYDGTTDIALNAKVFLPYENPKDGNFEGQTVSVAGSGQADSAAAGNRTVAAKNVVMSSWKAVSEEEQVLLENYSFEWASTEEPSVSAKIQPLLIQVTEDALSNITATYGEENQTVSFTNTAGQITAADAGAQIPEGEELTLTLTFETAGLDAGEHTGVRLAKNADGKAEAKLSVKNGEAEGEEANYDLASVEAAKATVAVAPKPLAVTAEFAEGQDGTQNKKIYDGTNNPGDNIRLVYSLANPEELDQNIDYVISPTEDMNVFLSSADVPSPGEDVTVRFEDSGEETADFLFQKSGASTEEEIAALNQNYTLKLADPDPVLTVEIQPKELEVNAAFLEENGSVLDTKTYDGTSGLGEIRLVYSLTDAENGLVEKDKDTVYTIEQSENMNVSLSGADVPSAGEAVKVQFEASAEDAEDFLFAADDVSMEDRVAVLNRNYKLKLTDPEPNLQAKIQPKEVEVTAAFLEEDGKVFNTKTYDGTDGLGDEEVVIAYSVSGLEAGDGMDESSGRIYEIEAINPQIRLSGSDVPANGEAPVTVDFGNTKEGGFRFVKKEEADSADGEIDRLNQNYTLSFAEPQPALEVVMQPREVKLADAAAGDILVSDEDRVYDGNAQIPVEILLDGVTVGENTESVTVAGTGTLPGSNAGAYESLTIDPKQPFKFFTDGKETENYYIDEESSAVNVDKEVEIEPYSLALDLSGLQIERTAYEGNTFTFELKNAQEYAAGDGKEFTADRKLKAVLYVELGDSVIENGKSVFDTTITVEKIEELVPGIDGQESWAENFTFAEENSDVTGVRTVIDERAELSVIPAFAPDPEVPEGEKLLDTKEYDGTNALTDRIQLVYAFSGEMEEGDTQPAGVSITATAGTVTLNSADVGESGEQGLHFSEDLVLEFTGEDEAAKKAADELNARYRLTLNLTEAQKLRARLTPITVEMTGVQLADKVYDGTAYIGLQAQVQRKQDGLEEGQVPDPLPEKDQEMLDFSGQVGYLSVPEEEGGAEAGLKNISAKTQEEVFRKFFEGKYNYHLDTGNLQEQTVTISKKEIDLNSLGENGIEAVDRTFRSGDTSVQLQLAQALEIGLPCQVEKAGQEPLSEVLQIRGTGTMDDANQGQDKTVHAGQEDLSVYLVSEAGETLTENYKLLYWDAQGTPNPENPEIIPGKVTVNIAPLELTIPVSAADKVYNKRNDVVLTADFNDPAAIGILSQDLSEEEIAKVRATLSEGGYTLTVTGNLSDVNVGSPQVENVKISISGGSDESYNDENVIITPEQDVFCQVTPLQITVDEITLESRDYNASDAIRLTATAKAAEEGVVLPDRVRFEDIVHVADVNAGTQNVKEFNQTGLDWQAEDTATGGDMKANYQVVSAVIRGLQVEITKVKIPLTQDMMRTYDRIYEKGNTSVDISLSGEAEETRATFTYLNGTRTEIIQVRGQGTTASADIGQNKAVTVGSLKPVIKTGGEYDPDGTYAEAANYELTGDPSAWRLTVNIGRKALNVQNARAVDRVYEYGNASVELVAEASNAEPGDTIVLRATGRLENPDAGTDKKVLRVTQDDWQIYVKEGDGPETLTDNYILNDWWTENLRVTVSPMELEITNVSDRSLTYNGSNRVDFYGAVDKGTDVSGQDFRVYATAVLDSANAGEYTVDLLEAGDVENLEIRTRTGDAAYTSNDNYRPVVNRDRFHEFKITVNRREIKADLPDAVMTYSTYSASKGVTSFTFPEGARKSGNDTILLSSRLSGFIEGETIVSVIGRNQTLKLAVDPEGIRSEAPYLYVGTHQIIRLADYDSKDPIGDNYYITYEQSRVTVQQEETFTMDDIAEGDTVYRDTEEEGTFWVLWRGGSRRQIKILPSRRQQTYYDRVYCRVNGRTYNLTAGVNFTDLAGDNDSVRLNVYLYNSSSGQTRTAGTRTITVRLDDSAPSASITLGSMSSSSAVRYNVFQRDNERVTLSVRDSESGIRRVRYSVVKRTEDLSREQLERLADEDFDWDVTRTFTEKTANFSRSFSIPSASREGYYFVIAETLDQAGNTKLYASNGIVVDRTAPVISQVTLSGDRNEESGIYTGNVTARFTVSDFTEDGQTTSGVASVTYSILRDGEAVEGYENISLRNVSSGRLSIGNLEGRGARRSYRIQVPASVFESNNVVIRITARDLAGNTVSRRSSRIMIDRTAPEVSVSYENNNVVNGCYFQSGRTAVVTVNDRNIDKDNVRITVYATVGLGRSVGGTYTVDELNRIMGAYGISARWLSDSNEGVREADRTQDRSCRLSITFGSSGGRIFDCAYSQIAVECTDLAGRNSRNTSYSGQTPHEFTVDHTPPVVRVTYTNDGAQISPGTSEGSQLYRQGSITMQVQIDELNFGTGQNTVWTVNGQTRAIGFVSAGTIRTGTLTFSEDGHYVTGFGYTDMAGNEANVIASAYFTVDNQAPSDGAVTIEPFGTWSSFSGFTNFSRSDSLTASIAGSDDLSGPPQISWYRSSEPLTEGQLAGVSWTSGSSLTISEEGQFILYARLQDQAENVSYVSSDGVILDRSLEAPEITITSAQPSQNIYREDVAYTIQVTDPTVGGSYAGLSSVRYEVLADGVVTQQDTYSFGQENRQNSFSQALTIDSASNNSNQVSVRVYAQDNAGNTSESETDVQIDVTAPQISVSYDLNAPENGSYYSQTRTATVTVLERNFDENGVSWDIRNTEGDQPVIGAWSHSAANGISDATVHTCEVVFAADGDYEFGLSVTDAAGNTGEYGRTDAFTIDQTLPEAEVAYDNMDSHEDGYYNASRTATVTITEHNFRAEDVEFTFTGESTPQVSEFESIGDVHTATIRFAEDGNYTFTMDYRDLAGNRIEEFEEESFVIDTEAPKVEIRDVEGANSGDVQPRILTSDTNYTAAGVEITLEGLNHEAEEPQRDTAASEATGGGETIVLANMPVEREYDDLYTLTVTVTDRAGNETTEEIQYSVNRYGSVYDFGEALDALLESYYAQAVEEDLVIHEYNVDTINFSELTVTKDGTARDLEEGTDFTVEEEEADGRKHYVYTLNREIFTEERQTEDGQTETVPSDGHYTITVYSEDEAGNRSSNQRTGDTIQFIIDSTAPMVVVTGLDGGPYNETSHTVSISAQDNMYLASLRVEVRYGRDTESQVIREFTAEELEESFGTVSVDLPEDSREQHVKVIATDLAGNTVGASEEEEISVTISTNFLVRFVSNRPLFYGTIAAAAVILLGIILLIVKKKKQKQTEQTK